MDRIKFLQEALELNYVQASITSKLIEDIPDNKLVDFIIFRMDFIQPMKSKELITKEAISEFLKLKYLNELRNGSLKLKSIDELKKFCKTYFKGKDLCNGAANYYDYVVLCMDNEGNLLNKFVVENGKYLKLDIAKENEVYFWLLNNQHKIGNIESIPYFEPELKYQQLESANNQDTFISPRTRKVLGATK